MSVKRINMVLLVVLIVTSCAPALTVVSPAETVVALPTFTSIPPPATPAPAQTPEPPTATSASTVPLDTQGPWLLYVRNSPRPGMMDVPEVLPEFILLNQDGSGFTSIALARGVDHFLMDGPNSANYIAQFDGRLYLFRPSDATGVAICGTIRYFCSDRFFTGDETGGLLASIYQANDDAIPELIIYEMPDGTIRDRFPLVQCTQDVNTCEKIRSIWEEMVEPIPQWSPNGRYLAFAAIPDGTSSDLFVYDSQDGSVRPLTHGPDWVGPIEWSPDGTQIIMQEILNEDMYTYGPAQPVISSVWSVSVNSNEIRLLLSGGAYMQQSILRWLDEKRFIAYEGSLRDPMIGALNLRFVDMDAGTSTMLFDDWFVMQSFDPIHETLAISKQITEKSPEGTLLISIKTATVRRLAEPPYLLDFQWDAGTGLFVSSYDCQNDSQSLQAFDYQGNFSCVPKPMPTPEPLETASYPAPNGKSRVSLKDGLWLESDGKATVPVSQETASDVIWCPDSSCFFFSVVQQNQQWTLYHVSLPDLTMKKVDEGIQSANTYQWLESKR